MRSIYLQKDGSFTTLTGEKLVVSFSNGKAFVGTEEVKVIEKGKSPVKRPLMRPAPAAPVAVQSTIDLDASAKADFWKKAFIVLGIAFAIYAFTASSKSMEYAEE